MTQLASSSNLRQVLAKRLMDYRSELRWHLNRHSRVTAEAITGFPQMSMGRAV